jgi:hypothetical protein
MIVIFSAIICMCIAYVVVYKFRASKWIYLWLKANVDK